MIKFVCYGKGKQPERLHLDGAYLVGADGVPVRSEIAAEGNVIRCAPRSTEPVGLALLWPVKPVGTILLETTRLPLRDKPYHLNVELARHRLMRMSLKREEWGLFDYPGIEDIAVQIDRARDLFVASLQHQDEPEEAAELADQSLAEAITASERLSQFHASVFLSRRQQSGGFNRRYIGAGLSQTCAGIAEAADWLDFARVPFTWRDIQPKEQGLNLALGDACVKACAAAKLPVRGGALLHFGVRSVPDWMYIYENDYETIAEYAKEHVRRTVKRYAGAVANWEVVSGVHSESVFDLSVEQIIDITRMAATITKQLAPKAQVIVDMTHPWGEYYARNQRTIPALLYADMVVQAGINFDAFGLQFLFGADGYHVRDMFQISALIDRLANLGKPLHVTAVACPSAGAAPEAGHWRGPWSDERQADWILAFLEVALSKPYVETVCFRDLTDGPDMVIPHSGLLRADLTPKPTVDRLKQLRQKLKK